MLNAFRWRQNQTNMSDDHFLRSFKCCWSWEVLKLFSALSLFLSHVLMCHQNLHPTYLSQFEVTQEIGTPPPPAMSQPDQILHWDPVGKCLSFVFDSRGKRPQYKFRERSLPPWWVCTCQRNVIIAKGGNMWLQDNLQIPNKHPQLPSVRLTLHEHICSLWLPAFHRPLLVRERANMSLSPVDLL